MVGTMPPTAQDALRGPVSTCSVQCSPASRPAPWPGTSARIGPLGPRRRRRRNAGQAAALATVDLVRASHGQPRTIPSRPARCRQATTPPTDHRHIDPLRPAGRPATPNHSGSSAARTGAAAAPRTPEACPSGHLDGTGRLDTGRLDAGCPLDRLDGHPTADRTRRTEQRPTWPASGLLATGDHPPGGPTSPGHGTWGRSATHDGSAVTAPAPRP
jgi:hypothetical protein